MTTVAVVAHERKLSSSDRRGLEEALAAADVETMWFDIKKAKKARKAAAQAIADGAEVVIACGGDGTVRAASAAIVGTDVALAVLPAGTANLFANAYGLPSSPADVVALVTQGHRTSIDSGVCNDRTFNVMAGAGFDAALIDDADSRKERLGMLAYVQAGLRNARVRDRFDATVTVDGEPFFRGRATCVLVGNIGTLAAGITAFPEASPTDGRLDVAVVTAAGLRQWAGVAANTLRRRPSASSHAEIGQGRAIEVVLGDMHRYQLDGGMKGRTKQLSFSVRPGALTLCAPVS